MRKRLWTLTSLIAILLIIGLVGCDNNPVAPVEDDPVLPTIPAEFSEMESISYSGSSPSTIDEAGTSMSYAMMNIGGPIGDLFANSNDSDVTDFMDLSVYFSDISQAFTATAAVNIDETAFTGDVNVALDESYGNASFKGALIASLAHTNLIAMNTYTDDNGTPGDGSDDITSTYPDLAMSYVGDPTYDYTQPLVGASFNVSMDLSGLDVKVTDAIGEEYDHYDSVNDVDVYVPNGIDTEYLRYIADVSFSASGSNLNIDAPAEVLDGNGDPVLDEWGDPIKTMTVTSGTIDFNVDMIVKIGFVLSSTDSEVDGCKVVGTLELEDALSGFDLTGIDIKDGDSLFNAISDFLVQISAPKISYTVFASDNTFLFAEDVNVSDELDDMLNPGAIQ